MSTPVIILKEGSSERDEDEVRQHILVAAQVLNGALRPLLGPHGKFKLIMDTFGDVTVTSSGATVLEEVDIEHPVAKILVELAKAMNKEVGDGVTSMVILASELLEQGIALQRQGVHASIIEEAFGESLRKAIEVLEKNAKSFKPTDRKTLFLIARTAVTGSLSRKERDVLAEIAVEAAMRARDGTKLDLDRIKLDKKGGEVMFETKLLEGIALDKELVHPAMPKLLKKPKIALIDQSLELRKTEYDSKMKFKDPSMLTRFMEQEQESLKEMVERIRISGANVVFCQKGIDDLVQYLLAKEKIQAVRRIKKSDMDKLSLATGAKITTSIDELNESVLGKAELVEERKVGDEKWVFVNTGANTKAVNLIFRGANDKIVGEAERMTKKALNALRVAISDCRVLPGAGATELEIARQLRGLSSKQTGKSALAVEAFIKSLESIPASLASNSGKDPNETLAKLRAAHNAGKANVGTGELEKDTVDAISAGILEPFSLKKSMLSGAVDTAIALLRIDRITAVAKFKAPPGKGSQESGY